MDSPSLGAFAIPVDYITLEFKILKIDAKKYLRFFSSHSKKLILIS